MYIKLLKIIFQKIRKLKKLIICKIKLKKFKKTRKQKYISKCIEHLNPTLFKRKAY